MNDLPLSEMKVLDLTQVMAGPFCCMILGDMGADVIKVEPPGSGDHARKSMGFRMKGEDTAPFLAVNRNKKSCTLNLKTETGRELFYELCSTVDVVVENFRPGVAARLGADYDTLAERNPRIVMASISGFGQTGPYGDRPGYDLIAQGMAGLMSVTGEAGRPPVKCGIPIADLAAGLFAAYGILSAYIGAQRTGQGQYVDTSLYEAALGLSLWETSELWATGRVPQPMGSAHRLTGPYQALRTADGWITVGANNPKLWSLLCDAIGSPGLENDPRFATNDSRMENMSELVDELEKTLRRESTEHWVSVLLDAGVPAGPILDYGQVAQDPHALARGMIRELEHPVEGTVKTLGNPIHLSETPPRMERPAPLLGEHTRQVLAEIGVDERRFDELRRQGVV